MFTGPDEIAQSIMRLHNLMVAKEGHRYAAAVAEGEVNPENK
jgi:hypothetical protein